MYIFCTLYSFCTLYPTFKLALQNCLFPGDQSTDTSYVSFIGNNYSDTLKSVMVGIDDVTCDITCLKSNQAWTSRRHELFTAYRKKT